MSAPPGLRLARYAMGTRFELVLAGDDETRMRAAGEEALDEIEYLDARLDLFKKNSLVSHVNRSAHEAPVKADAEFCELVALCRSVSEASSGAFDITVGALMESWGFHDRASDGRDLDARIGNMRGIGERSQDRRGEAERAEEKEAPKKEIQEKRADEEQARDERKRAMDCVGYQWIELDEEAQTIRFLKPDMRLDFGAVAKGFALDRAKEILLEAGVENVLMHGGTSTIVALGAPEGAAAWKVAIEDPAQDDAIFAWVEVRDRALSVSAPHGRIIEEGSGTLGHVMNVAEAGPARTPLDLAAITCASAALADAWATAFVARGASRFDELYEAAARGIKPLTVLAAVPGVTRDRKRLMGDEIEIIHFPDP